MTTDPRTAGSGDPLGPDPDHDITLDAAALRVLAHPMRLVMLNALRERGPSTARRLAKELELDSGAASYHLRRLAAGGLIEEDQERGTRRDRWWRARHQRSYHDPATVAPDERQGSRAYTNAVVLAYGDQLRRLAAVVPLFPDDWFEASIFSDCTVSLTPDELNEMKRELVGVIDKYRTRRTSSATEEPAEGAAQVSVQLQMFPRL
ncbi:helix-turn-helix domain-containing protein [Streptomyces sp. NPDC057137]|uniref:helix-turn-helix domain-containing protein n=1 Tax=Streptomyces sp. NPDC057137 TaxID=3346030 RepID=UPI003637B1F6